MRYRGIRDFGDDEGGRFVMAGVGVGVGGGGGGGFVGGGGGGGRGEGGCTRWGIRLGGFVSGVCVCYTGEQT